MVVGDIADDAVAEEQTSEPLAEKKHKAEEDTPMAIGISNCINVLRAS